MIPEVFKQVEPYVSRALKGEVIEEIEFTRPAHGPGTVESTNVVSYQPALDEAGEVIGISARSSILPIASVPKGRSARVRSTSAIWSI